MVDFASEEAHSPARANILVIDDTPENLDLLSIMLTQQGYKVRSVTKGVTGLRGAQMVPPDLILLDVNMPQMSGYDVCQQLKADDRTRHIPVIFISALEDVLDKVKAFAVGGVDYITKPFHVEEVLARIEAHLTIGRLQRQLQAQNVQLQQEMHERERVQESFAKAFNASPNPIAIATFPTGQVLDVNPSFLRMTGYSSVEVIDHTLAELNLDWATRLPDPLREEFETCGAIHNWEFELRTKLGEVRVVLLSLEQIELNNRSCILWIANDITQRKQLENEFISLVSHELRTPLTSLMGSLDLLGAGQLGELSDRGKHVLAIAATNTERLIRLVNDILDLERIKSGTITMQKKPCHLAPLFIQAADAMQSLAQQWQIHIEMTPLDVTLWADGDRLVQTFTNLLNNAIKFSQPGGTIWFTAQLMDHEPSDSPQVLIAVRDRGRGIPEDKLQLIFERFQQVDASDSRQKGGTGLGLSICRNIVEQHDGHIWAKSTLGEGSTFYVQLPIVE